MQSRGILVDICPELSTLVLVMLLILTSGGSCWEVDLLKKFVRGYVEGECSTFGAQLGDVLSPFVFKIILVVPTKGGYVDGACSTAASALMC